MFGLDRLDRGLKTSTFPVAAFRERDEIVSAVFRSAQMMTTDSLVRRVLAQNDVRRLPERVDDGASSAGLQTSPGARLGLPSHVRVQALGQVTDAARVTAQLGVYGQTNKNVFSAARRVGRRCPRTTHRKRSNRTAARVRRSGKSPRGPCASGRRTWPWRAAPAPRPRRWRPVCPKHDSGSTVWPDPRLWIETAITNTGRFVARVNTSVVCVRTYVTSLLCAGRFSNDRVRFRRNESVRWFLKGEFFSDTFSTRTNRFENGRHIHDKYLIAFNKPMWIRLDLLQGQWFWP